MLDVYDWILSPEIREHMRANYPLSVEEKMHIICGGFRSIEEKETALRTLLDESGEKREQIETMIRLYGLAMKELRKTGPEHLFVLPTVAHRWSQKWNSLITSDVRLCSSYAELLKYTENRPVEPHISASKWEQVNGTWENVIDFDIQRVKGVYCTTRFWPSEKKEKEWGFDFEMTELQLELGNDVLGCHRLPYPIPFMTGDLVKLDGPMLNKPLFGVMDNALDLNGTRYMWFGFVEGNHFGVLDLSYSLLHLIGEYRVIDCLYPAKPEELPEGEEILQEISEYLSRQPQRDSDADNEFLDIFGVRNKRVFRRWVETPFPDLLAQVRQERRAHG